MYFICDPCGARYWWWKAAKATMEQEFSLALVPGGIGGRADPVFFVIDASPTRHVANVQMRDQLHSDR